ncbi:MAG: DUF488 domain-containing protein [Alphaproteobacteria bacterium]|nr:DUF488 domain-containing protein [Alphaproteobacteria bacterium]
MSAIRLKRVYDPHAPEDGIRVLVDRLWPRGLKREAAAIDLWLKAVAPSDALRRWFGHDPRRWAEFRERYHAELRANSEAIAPLRDLLARGKTVTLLFAAKDMDHNNAVALKDLIDAPARGDV